MDFDKILDKGNEERIKAYPLTFFDVVNEIFETGGMYQGERFKNGYFISLGKSTFSYNQIKLFRYDWNKGTCDEDNPVLSKGLIEQRYREVFTKEEIWRGTEDWRYYIEMENT